MKAVHNNDLERAKKLADAADAVTMRYYLSSKLEISTKPDASPVTQADTETETTLRNIVHAEFKDAYLGEEGARAQSENGRTWIVDPIDGTRNFMRGMPLWATLIALEDKDGPLASIVTAPALGRRWWAIRGEGAYTSDVDGKVRRIRVTKVSKVEDAYLGYGSIFSWDRIDVGSAKVLDLLRSAWRHRGLGDFMTYMLVAEGAMDASLEPDLKGWDIAAPSLIVMEAGGSVWSAAGEETTAEMPRMVIASNGMLETELRKRLR